VVANLLAVGTLAGPLLVVRGMAFAVSDLAIPLGAWSLVVVRFRHAAGVERQQLRWLAVAVAPVVAALAVLRPAIGAAILRDPCTAWTASSVARWLLPRHGGIDDVGGGDHGGQRQPAALADQVQLAPRLATTNRIFAQLVPRVGAHAHGLHARPRPVQ
jgi:hypothetical protein